MGMMQGRGPGCRLRVRRPAHLRPMLPQIPAGILDQAAIAPKSLGDKDSPPKLRGLVPQNQAEDPSRATQLSVSPRTCRQATRLSVVRWPAVPGSPFRERPLSMAERPFSIPNSSKNSSVSYHSRREMPADRPTRNSTPAWWTTRLSRWPSSHSRRSRSMWTPQAMRMCVAFLDKGSCPPRNAVRD